MVQKVHPELQVLLIDFMQYQPKLLIDEHHVAPEELDMHEELAPALEEMAVDKLLADITMIEVVLQ